MNPQDKLCSAPQARALTPSIRFPLSTPETPMARSLVVQKEESAQSSGLLSMFLVFSVAWLVLGFAAMASSEANEAPGGQVEPAVLIP